jgi:hypothetical protein
MKRTAIKSSRPKTTKIRQSARGEDCTINLEGVCNYDPDTVVWAHSNKAIHGKSMGRKADDEWGAYACFSCHACVDGQSKRPSWLTKDDVDLAFDFAMEKSRAILARKNLI